MKNKLAAIIEQRQISRYRFWKDTGLSRTTAYQLIDDPTYVGGQKVQEAVCEALQIQPSEWMYYDAKSP